MDKAAPSLLKLIHNEKPLQIAGVINAFAARLADQAGFNAIYLSGAGVANANLALPDLGMTSVNDVVEQVQKITASSSLPLLVDLDTGWGNPLNVKRAFQLVSLAGAAGAHIEDQQDFKRCGHREGKHLVKTPEMIDRIKAALDGRSHEGFMVMARTDALCVEEEAKVLDRVYCYQEAGADAIFLEAVTKLEQYQKFSDILNIPVLANITEFGKTPLFTRQELAQVGVSMILYPLSAFRAMNAAALEVYRTIRQEGTQKSALYLMQDRKTLYQLLHYEQYEQELDNFLKNNGE